VAGAELAVQYSTSYNEATVASLDMLHCLDEIRLCPSAIVSSLGHSHRRILLVEQMRDESLRISRY